MTKMYHRPYCHNAIDSCLGRGGRNLIRLYRIISYYVHRRSHPKTWSLRSRFYVLGHQGGYIEPEPIISRRYFAQRSLLCVYTVPSNALRHFLYCCCCYTIILSLCNLKDDKDILSALLAQCKEWLLFCDGAGKFYWIISYHIIEEVRTAATEFVTIRRARLSGIARALSCLNQCGEFNPAPLNMLRSVAVTHPMNLRFALSSPFPWSQGVSLMTLCPIFPISVGTLRPAFRWVTRLAVQVISLYSPPLFAEEDPLVGGAPCVYAL